MQKLFLPIFIIINICTNISNHSFDNNCFLAGEGTMTPWDFFDKNEATYPLICELLNHSSFLNSLSPFLSVTFFQFRQRDTVRASSCSVTLLTNFIQVVLYSLEEPCDLSLRKRTVRIQHQ